MKSFSSLLLCLLLYSTCLSQNNLFIPFGQSADDVKQFLGSRDYILNIHEDLEMESVRAVLDQNKHVEYAFRDGTLYATTVTRNYDNRRTAKEIQKNCLDYMEYISNGNTQLNDNEEIVCYTAITDARVIKLFIQQHTKSTTLTLTSVSRRFGPPMQEDDIFYETDLLQKRFISN